MFSAEDNWSSSSSSSANSDDDDFFEDAFQVTAKQAKENQKAKQQQKSSTAAVAVPTSVVPQPVKAVVSGFHKPGDAAFSLVAVPPAHLIERESQNAAKAKNENKNSSFAQQKKFSGNDAQGIGSTTWASSVCRCLRCELLRTSMRWNVSQQQNQKNSTAPPCLVVLLDADNFGFPQFARKPPPNNLFQYFNQTGNAVFVWAFYGANFEKAFKVDLENYVEATTQKDNKNNSNGKFPKHLNTWGLLKSKNSVQCTKCEGSAQAADLVIEAVATMIADEVESIRCCLLSGDKDLQTAVQKIWSDARGETHPESFFVPTSENTNGVMRRNGMEAEEIWKVVFGGFSAKKESKRRQRE